MAKKSGVFERLEAEIVKDAGKYVEEKVKRKVLRISEISVLILLGFFLISFGLATILGSYFEVLSNGFSFVVLGVTFLVISFFIKV